MMNNMIIHLYGETTFLFRTEIKLCNGISVTGQLLVHLLYIDYN